MAGATGQILIRSATSSKHYYAPAISGTQALLQYYKNSGVIDNDTLEVVGKHNITGKITMNNQIGSSMHFNVILNDSVYCSDNFTVGCTNAAGFYTFKANNSILNIGAFVNSNLGTQSLDFGGSTIRCNGNWTNGNNAGTTWNFGTSKIIFKTAATILDSAKNFNYIQDSTSSGIKLTLGDSLLTNIFKVVSGAFNAGKNRINTGGFRTRGSALDSLIDSSVIS